MAKRPVKHDRPEDRLAIAEVDMNQSDAALGARVREIFEGSGKETDILGLEGAKGSVAAEFPVVRMRGVARHAALPAVKGEQMLARPFTGPRGLPAAEKFYVGTPVSPEGWGDALDQALVAAEGRGKTLNRSILMERDMLTAEKVADLIGISRQAVNKRRLAGQVLGLRGGTKTYKYPAWQVLPNGAVIEGLADLLLRFEGDAWATYRMLVEPYPDGSGAPVYEKLRQGAVVDVFAHVDATLGGSVT